MPVLPFPAFALSVRLAGGIVRRSGHLQLRLRGGVGRLLRALRDGASTGLQESLLRRGLVLVSSRVSWRGVCSGRAG